MATNQPDWQWETEIGKDIEIGDDIGKGIDIEIYDLCKASVCMTDPESGYVRSIVCNGIDITNDTCWADSNVGLAVVFDQGDEIGDPVEPKLLNGIVTIDYDAEKCVAENKGKARIILP